MLSIRVINLLAMLSAVTKYLMHGVLTLLETLKGNFDRKR